MRVLIWIERYSIISEQLVSSRENLPRLQPAPQFLQKQERYQDKNDQFH